MTTKKESDSCLVLCIEECENYVDTKSIDTRLFITYDFENDSYVVYGKREDTKNTMFVPYFLRCDYTSDLYDFIRCIFDIDNKINVTLYNYNNMPLDCESVDYNFMENNREVSYEIVGYDNTELKRNIKTMLRNLRNMYNLY
jgi:hypothetical protein